MTPRKPKHVPQRMCVICRQRYDKRRLTRIVNSKEEGVSVDLSGKRNGRGAYLCDQLTCWEQALSDSRTLNKALKAEITAEELQRIAEYRPAANEAME